MARVSRVNKHLPAAGGWGGGGGGICFDFEAQPYKYEESQGTTFGQHFTVLMWTVAQHMGFV